MDFSYGRETSPSPAHVPLSSLAGLPSWVASVAILGPTTARDDEARLAQ